MGRDRGQSEALGTILLVGLVVIAVTVFGAVTIPNATSDKEVLLDVLPDSTDNALPSSFSDLVLRHNGGDRIPLTELQLIVNGPSGECRKDFESGSLSGGDGDNDFDPGEAWQASGSCAGYTSGDVVRLIVLHEPTSDAVYNERWDVA